MWYLQTITSCSYSMSYNLLDKLCMYDVVIHKCEVSDVLFMVNVSDC